MRSNPALWQNLQNYAFDAVDAALPFSLRLARDNGWSHAFTCDVIEEYKRFMYLICVSHRSLTPSEEVDQVWHQHLTYTRDYWERFCPEILGRKVHHTPTSGGDDEDRLYEGQYADTLSLYQTEFGTPPPRHIWPDTDSRFSPSPARHIDSTSVFILPKWQVFLCLGAGMVLTLAACKPKDIEAVPPEMIIFGLLIAMWIVIGWLGARRHGRRGGRGHCSSGGGCGSGGCSTSGSGDNSGCGGGCGGD